MRYQKFFAWFVCGLGALYYAYEYLLRIAPSVMEMPLRNYFHLSHAGFGLLSAIYYYAYVPMQVPVGVLMDRFGPRKLLTFACFLCVVGTFMFGNTLLFQTAAMGRFLVGFGSAFAFVGVLKLATIWLPQNQLGMVAGIAAALGTVGAMFGDNVLGYMVQIHGWQFTLNRTAVFGLGMMALLWIGIPGKHSKLHQAHRGETSSFKKNMQDLLIIAKNKQIWINGMYGCLVYLPTTVFAELWGIPYLHHAKEMSLADAQYANSLLFLGFTIGAPMMGFISDWFENRKLPMLIGATGAAILMSIILYIPNLSLVTLSLLMFALGLLYGAQAIVFAVGRELSPKDAAGTAIATTNMIVMVGAMVLQPLIGLLLEWSVSLRSSYVVGEMMHLNNMALPYGVVDYQLAMSIIPIGIFCAAILTFFLKETHAHTHKK